ncbi:glycoside hydrolase N-terminal domain-containing protein [Kribbella sp. NBC_00382]|uniref:glycosyl hydrolase family 95 catalytic domain-containing protein n=1 Tax=Kribbella sp. NBC_00382 TaxID=2975967 RepID=UPI002E21C917
MTDRLSPGDSVQPSRRDVIRYGGGLTAVLALAGLPVFAETAAADSTPAGPELVPPSEATRLWYSLPGKEDRIIEEGLPIGNGRIGALVTGDPANDTLYLTDSTLWTGGLNDVLDGDGQFPYDTTRFGSLSMLAKATVSVTGHNLSSVQGYERELDLSNGLTGVRYELAGVEYRRRVYCSHPDDVVVVHLTQSGGGTYSGRIALAGTHGEPTSASGTEAGFSGALGNGLKYAGLVSAASVGGSVRTQGIDVVFENCDEVLIVISGGTNYLPDPTRGYRDPQSNPLDIARAKARRAIHRQGASLLAAHVADYRRLYESMTVSLGTSTPAQRGLDTPARLALRATYGAVPDPELEAGYLQFGRYLTITGSRSSVPINLQGLWLDRNDPDWMADYHTDINLQMNYWLTDRAGLGACYEALTSYCLGQFPSWSRTTTDLFQDSRNGFRNSSGRVAGWTVAISTNVHGGGGWWWNPTGSAWLCNTLFEHYEFTGDRDFLERIYPLLKGACEFWRARLLTTTVTDPATGGARQVLIDDADWSAEHGPTDAKGITYAQELVWQLFANLRTACADLGRDRGYAATVKGLQERLYLPQVSPTTGWLEEWMTDENLGETTHRHLSPLIGLYPGDRIAADTSPAPLIEGATKLLTARGMASFGWAMAWRGLCWARLKNATRAYRSVLTVLKPSVAHSNGSGINLFDMYSFGNRSTFQIDANLGTPTAMLEMLVYSRPGLVELLPAAPDAWGNGSATGIGVRGGFTIDLTWSDRQVTKATIHSVGGRETTVRYGSWNQRVRVTPGKPVTLKPPPRTYDDEPDESPLLIVNRGSGKAIDVPGASTVPGTVLIQWSKSGAANQQWVLTDLGDHRYHLTSVSSGLLAEIGGGVTTPGAAVTQWPDTGGDSQMWRIEDAGGGYSKIVNVRSGLLLSVQDASTADGANLVQLADTGDASQQWQLIRS